MSTRFSKTGAALALCYAVITMACIGVSISDQGDPKGSFVLLQLPIAVQAALLDSIGLGEFLTSLGWVSTYIVLGVPTIIILYIIGRFLGRLLSA